MKNILFALPFMMLVCQSGFTSDLSELKSHLSPLSALESMKMKNIKNFQGEVKTVDTGACGMQDLVQLGSDHMTKSMILVSETFVYKGFGNYDPDAVSYRRTSFNDKPAYGIPSLNAVTVVAETLLPQSKRYAKLEVLIDQKLNRAYMHLIGRNLEHALVKLWMTPNGIFENVKFYPFELAVSSHLIELKETNGRYKMHRNTAILTVVPKADADFDSIEPCLP
jgi:hypothetical protein